MSDQWKFETQSVHAGYTPDPSTKAVAVPIYQTVAYAFDSAQHGADLFDLKVAGNIYSRIMNPTCDVLEKRVAALEGGIAGLAVASGQAAIMYAIQTIAEAGDNIVSSTALYGGTYNLFAHTLPQFGIETRFADYREPKAFEKLIDARTKAVFVESVGNPRGNITDIEAVAKVAHAHGVPTVVHMQVAEACGLPGALPAGVVHGLDAPVLHQWGLVGVRLALAALHEHVAGVLAAHRLDHRLGDRVAHDQAATLLTLDMLARHVEHRYAKLGDLDLPVPLQAAHHIVTHAGVQDEQRHARQMVRQLGEQLALLAPADGRGLALVADERQQRDLGGSVEPCAAIFIAPGGGGQIENPAHHAQG